MTFPHETSSVHFLLTESALIACNKGRTFSNGGLDAICTSNRSNKTDLPLESSEVAREAVTKVRELATGLYLTEAGPTLLDEQCKAEVEVSRSYGARILLELLQNADDAMGVDSIGYKGLGFKCILNVTETPRLHSGPLSVHFDRNLSASHLAARGLCIPHESLPVLRLPFWCETPEAGPVAELRRDYDTVLILPLRSKKARRRVIDEWAEIVGDPSILVFLQNIESVSWAKRESVRHWTCQREGSKVIVGGGTTGALRTTSWKVARGPNGLGAAAMPTTDDADGGISPLETPHLRAFFPIHKEHSPFPKLLIHGQFPLDPSREYVLNEPAEVTPVVHEIAEAICTLLRECTTFGRILDLVRPRIEPSKMDGLERALWEKIRDQVADLPIPGEASKTFESVRVTPGGFYPKINHWESSAAVLCQIKISTKRWLKKVRPAGIADLPLLDEGWENPIREFTLRGLVDQSLLTADQFQTLPLFPVGEGPISVSPSEYFVAAPPKTGIPNVPDAIPLRCLSAEAERDLPIHSQVLEYLDNVGGLRKFEIGSIIEEAVIPSIPGVDSAQLLEFLFLLTRGSAVLEKRFDWVCSWRVELARQLCVPVRDGPSRAPIEVYAGQDWTGDEFLEEVFAHRSDRSFLSPPPDDPEERDAFKKFYEWIGVGFCPKVVTIPGVPSLENPKAKMQVGAEWSEGRFVLDDPPAEWDFYCSWLQSRATSRRKLASHSARLRQNWMLDCDLSELERPGAWGAVVRHWDYYASYLKAVWFQSSNQQHKNDNERVEGESYLFWIFSTRRWVPTVAKTGLQALTEVFIKGPISEQLKEWAPEVDGETPEELAKEFKIPRVWADLDDARWVLWLKRLESCDASSIQFRNTIQLVYRAFLNNVKGERIDRFSDCPIWAVQRDSQHEEAWVCLSGEQRQTMLFVDRPDLDELPIPDVPLFAVRLGAFSGKAIRLLGIEPLSEHIAFEIASGIYFQPDNALSARVREKLGLLCVASAGISPDDSLRSRLFEEFSSLEILLSDELRVTACLRGLPLTEVPVPFPFLHAPGERKLFLSISFAQDGDVITERAWGQVAAALLMGPNIPESIKNSLHLLEKLLRLESAKDVEDSLRSAGLSMDDVEQFRMETEAFVDLKDDKSESDVAPSKVVDPVERPPKAGTSGVSGHAENGPMREGHTPASSGGKAPQKERTRQGLEAQEWLRSQLAEILNLLDWTTSATVVKDEERRESDIVLTHPVKGEFHIEVKRRNGTDIFWSKLEVEKAWLHRDRYAMAILTPQNDGADAPYQVHWIASPLDALDGCEKFSRWNWTHFDEPFNDSGWGLPSTNVLKGPDRFSFRIVVKDEILQPFDSRGDSISQFLEGLDC